MYVEALKSALEVLRYKPEARFFPNQALPTERETSHRSPGRDAPITVDRRDARQVMRGGGTGGECG